MQPIKFPKTAEKYDFVRNLVKNFKIVPYLEEYLGTEIQHFTFEYTPKPQDDAWHPSGHCTAKVSDLWKMAKANMQRTENGESHSTQDFSATTLKTFMVGHFWHALLQKAVVDLGLAKEEAIERRGFKVWEWDHLHYIDPDHVLYGEFPIHHNPNSSGLHSRPVAYHWATGSGDVAPLVTPDGDDFVVDFKTMSSHQFKSNSLPEWAAAKYEAQINIYMDWFDTDRGIIIPIQKDSPHEMKEFEFVRNQPLIDAIYEKWEFVSLMLDEDECPDEDDDKHFDVDNLCTGPVAQ